MNDYEVSVSELKTISMGLDDLCFYYEKSLEADLQGIDIESSSRETLCEIVKKLKTWYILSDAQRICHLQWVTKDIDFGNGADKDNVSQN